MFILYKTERVVCIKDVYEDIRWSSGRSHCIALVVVVQNS